MEKSIEQIWNNGFLRDDKLLAPKINNLYNKKSQLLIEKLKYTYTVDNKSILPLAVLFFAISVFFEHYLLGIYLIILMLTLFFLNRKKLRDLGKISILGSNYEYLLEYRKMLESMNSFYTKLLALGVPIAGMIGYYLYFRNTPMFEDFLLLDLWFKLSIILGVAILLSSIGVGAYKITSYIIYGKFLKKINEIIADMQELRKE